MNYMHKSLKIKDIKENYPKISLIENNIVFTKWI